MMITWLRWRLPGAYNMTTLSLSLLYQSVFIITLLGYKFHTLWLTYGQSQQEMTGNMIPWHMDT